VTQVDTVAVDSVTANAPSFTREELILLSDLNLAEFVRHTARYGGTVLEEDGLLLFAGEHSQPGPYRNGALRLDGRLSGAAVIERANRFFAARGRSYVLWVREHADADVDDAVHAHRFAPLEPEPRLPQLALTSRPPLQEAPEGVVIKRVEDEQERHDFVIVNAEGWGMGRMPIELASAMFFHPDSAVAPNTAAYLAYVDGKPAAGAMAIVAAGSVGGYWGATAPWARRRGLSDLCIRAMFNAGFDLGAKVAVCQVSKLGAGNVLRMGFEVITHYRRYISRSLPATWE
jgi:hypothetical protein